jgi:predicted RNA-binding Zn-ribbon protein involved in translation (DUF1610 family)
MPREWHGGVYPPGTPRPYSTAVLLTCPECGEVTRATEHHELGAVDLSPEECPKCGEPWPNDIESEPDEPDPDEARDREIERGLEERDD